MDGAKIRKDYHELYDSCKLSTMEIWALQDEIRDTLYDKGYDLINFCNAPCKYGYFNAIDCYTKVASKLVEEIEKHGFNIILVKNREKPSISWIVFPFNMTHEIHDVVNDFEVIT